MNSYLLAKILELSIALCITEASIYNLPKTSEYPKLIGKHFDDGNERDTEESGSYSKGADGEKSEIIKISETFDADSKGTDNGKIEKIQFVTIYNWY